ncbi:hypothetical protein [Nocardia xishanensis]|uniref:hypothetical protein n=1 Tax=Nocardia xishanensis TaxID=238964 RepID=UPI00082BC0A4|nr:hypothetical protein [Nocardia xishanensis]
MDSSTTPNHPIDIELALGIYLNGFQSGIASTASALGKAGADISNELASQLATRILASVKADPAALETMRDQIRANLAGADTGPQVLKLYKWDNRPGQ